MKKIHTILAPLCMAVLSITSCISDEETVTSPECGITSFSVSDIKSSVVIKNAKGNDTTITKTISGSEIRFNIDQVNGKIYSIDTLPSWTDLSRVVARFTSYGTVFGQTRLEANDTLYYYVNSGTDSLDLRKPLSIYAVSTDAMSKKKYTIEMYKSDITTDTLEWKQSTVNAEVGDINHTVNLGSNVFMFFDKDGESFVTETSNGTDWTTSKTENIVSESVLSISNIMYALGKDSGIYSSNDGKSWTKASSINVDRILAADNYYVYAFDGTNIIGAKHDDLNSWDVYGSENVDKLPTKFITSQRFTSKTNKSLDMVTMVGLNDSNKDNGVVWFKISSLDKSANQDWSYTNITKQNLFKFPYLDELSTTTYDDAIFAIGKSNGVYTDIYRSDDHGISWHILNSKYPLPSDINNGDTTNASIINVNGELWIVKGKNIWKGRIY